jgi:uncharacterized protein (TIGR02145 family)
MPASNERVFLCHASEDKPRVMELYAHLKQAGLHPWIDKEDIPPASDWDREIIKTIQAARIVIVCFSRQLISKTGYVQRELDIAFEMAQRQSSDTLFLIALRLDSCEVPARYSNVRRLDLLKGVDTLIELLKVTLGLFTDPRDGQIYRTVLIGNQTWLAENLNYDLPSSRIYSDHAGNAMPYGRLYSWAAALEACPLGWHLPNCAEWQQLALTVGTAWDHMGSQLYEALIDGGRTGFNAVLGGMYDSRNAFKGCYEKLQNGYYWGGSPETGSFMFVLSAKSGNRTFRFAHENRDDGLSCRYIRDAEA